MQDRRGEDGTVASSIIGPIIPPSVIMVIYAALADLSVLTLFAAAIVPGLLLGLSCAAVVFVKSLRGDLPVSAMTVSRERRPKALRDGLIVMSLPAFILFGTVSGIFTPTEAGGIAVVLAILLGAFVFRELTLRSTLEAFRTAARLTAALFLIFATVQIINYVLILGGVQGDVRDLLDRERWAREIGTDREACAKTGAGVWILREVAKTSGLPEEAVDELLTKRLPVLGLGREMAP